ncbi:hypothetical protein [Lacibacter sp.]|uniref:hypothetical protein n=1 Tax=Lacibacter sp. TaxID=1915409 RepID=UPI002B4B2A40|nr:hypothetical protein [Lacibacter sp.]HLP38971.1 hypothetical protein [Lacibacter sp.]
MKRLKNIRSLFMIQLMVIYTRYLLGAAFVFASIIKMKGLRFTSSSGELAPINTSLHYFETMYQSDLYWKFLGLCQFLAGALLMTQVFSLLGAVVYFAVIVNIFMITLSYDFGFTPVITGAMLLANLLLLAWDWNKLKLFFNIQPNVENIDASTVLQNRIWAFTGTVLLLFTALYRVLNNSYDFLFWFLGSVFITITGFFVYIINRSLAKK